MARFVPSVGFLVSGLGLAASVGTWTGVFSMGAIGNVPGLLAALVASGAFAALRYGAGDRRLALLAGVGSGGLALAASVALLYPVTIGDQVSVGWGLPVAFVLGIVGVAVADATWHGVERPAFVEKSAAALLAIAIGFLGLVVGYLAATMGYVVLPRGATLVDQGVTTALFSVGLGIVAVGFLYVRNLGFDYIDLRWPDRRGWLYVVGGVVGMFAILLAVGAASNVLGLPSTQHSIMESARANPVLLLVFVPLSWIAIGPGEELLMRNIIQKSLYDAFSRRSAVLVGTLVFTAVHLPAYATGGPAAIFATLLRLFAISLVLGVVYERTENVVVSALVHGTYDAIQFGLAFVALTSGHL